MANARHKTIAVVAGFTLLGLLVLVGTIVTYFWLGGFYTSPSDHATELANLGVYVGGIAGPLLSFLALIAIVWTLRLQSESLQRDRDRQLADQHVRWLETTYKDIQDLLESPFNGEPGSSPATLRGVLYGEVKEVAVDRDALKARVTELMQLLIQYCEAVALYRINISKFFDLRIFVDRGARLLDRVKPFHAMLGSTSPITIEFLDMHLRGEQSRQNPEALKRRTRN